MADKSINDLYAESQLQLHNALLANLEACRAIAGLVSGELKTSWFTVQKGPDGIKWSWQKPEEPASAPAPE